MKAIDSRAWEVYGPFLNSRYRTKLPMFCRAH
jgi:hypothetical protein